MDVAGPSCIHLAPSMDSGRGLWAWIRGLSPPRAPHAHAPGTCSRLGSPRLTLGRLCGADLSCRYHERCYHARMAY
eukprot:6116107-Prymnesium_polylepis.2